jgi:hypothetical protein
MNVACSRNAPLPTVNTGTGTAGMHLTAGAAGQGGSTSTTSGGGRATQPGSVGAGGSLGDAGTAGSNAGICTNAADPATCHCVPGAYVRNGACQCYSLRLQSYVQGTPDVCPTVGCTDKMLDADNCGTCGLKCGATSTCNGGTCGPAPTVLLTPVAGCMAALTIAVNAGTVYYADATHNTINRIGASAPLATNEMGATWLAINGSDLYWYNKGTNTIRKLAGATGTPTNVFTPKTMTATLPAQPTEVDTVGGFLVTPDGTSVYVSVGTNVVRISATTVGGGAPVVVVEEKRGGLPGALAFNGTSNIVYPTGLNEEVDAPILGTPASCGVEDPMMNIIMTTCPRLANSEGAILLDFIAVIAGKAFWIDGANVKAEMVPAAGGAGTTFEAISMATNTITAATNTADTIYFAEDGIVEKAAAASNPSNDPPILLARGQMAPTSMAVDATKVYWSTADCSIASLNR